MANSVIIPNSHGIMTYVWTFIPAGKQFTVTCGYKDNLFADDPSGAAAIHRVDITASGCPANATNMTTQWRFEGCKALQRTVSGVLIAGASLSPVTGSAASIPALQPVLLPYIVSKSTIYAGRQYRGRVYPPFTNLDEGNVDYNGSILTGSVTTLQGQWTSFGTTIRASNYPPVLLHTTPHSGTAPVPTLITGFTVRSVVGVQRRRRAKGA